MVLANLCCYLLGTGWFMAATGSGLWAALSACVIPFVLPISPRAGAPSGWRSACIGAWAHNPRALCPYCPPGGECVEAPVLEGIFLDAGGVPVGHRAGGLGDRAAGGAGRGAPVREAVQYSPDPEEDLILLGRVEGEEPVALLLGFFPAQQRVAALALTRGGAGQHHPAAAGAGTAVRPHH